MDLASLVDQSRHYRLASETKGKSLPGLIVLCRDTTGDLEAVVYEPVVCVILQGGKETSIGNQFVELRPGDALLVSHDLPVLSRITNASPQHPYIAVVLKLDLGLVRGLYEQLAESVLQEADGQSLAAGPAEPALLQALGRYLDLIDNPLDQEVLGPSILREIHYRLLLSPAGTMLRSLLVAGSHSSRIAKAILRLRRDFRSPLSLPELARAAGMSTTSFHPHFKAITGTTPLQYQKSLRLIAARALLADGGQSVTEAAYATGYESATHFSRDYRRKFGNPPRRDTRVGVSEP